MFEKQGGQKYLDMELRTSPHYSRGVDVPQIMRNVVYALLPAAAMSVYTFGLSALALFLVTTVSAVLTEFILGRLSGHDNTVGDFSAVITGLLLGMTLPPGFPLWMAAAGGAISIAMGKFMFGGLGFNVFNPALLGRAFLQAAFPVAITTWDAPFAPGRFIEMINTSLALPFMTPPPHAATGATPLAALKFDGQVTPSLELLLGTVSGSAGETSALLLALGGLYLAARKMLDWRIPAAMLGTVVVLSGILHTVNPQYPSPVFMLFSGGLMLGAVFMATDMVTSPVTGRGVLMFGLLTGVLTVVIRIWGGLPEGVMYAIILGNAATPLINSHTQPRKYGTVKPVKQKKQQQGGA
ncbi:MAG: RnfABCDGE type electron transport complex subunit D [Deltaproteobacteria bacterium]|nr:RnfABCDGE type electron transport complex subunit D [Deltaproteobacteria bacterium]